MNLNCTRCGRKLTKPRLAARKRKCYPCECAVRREQKQRTHDRNIESEDFTAADYWRLYDMQGGTCAVYTCRASGKSKHLTVDHDHSCKMGHDPKRWCRVCVRGLTCSMHNEWIGRTGDNAEIFESLANYLWDPPARSILMGEMIVGDDAETVLTLNTKYGIRPQRAFKMLDLARGVGPSPIAVPNGTITIRYIRVPRTGEQLYQIIESAPRIDAIAALKLLIGEHGFSEPRAKVLLNNVWEKGTRKIRTKNGVIVVQYHGRDQHDGYIYSIEDGK